MGALLSNLTRTVIAGFVLVVVLFVMYYSYGDYEGLASIKRMKFFWLSA